MSTEKIIQILLGLIAAVAIALASFALSWGFDTNAQIGIMQNTLELKFKEFAETHQGLADDTEEMNRLTKQLSKHWRLHNWTKDQIAELRHKTQMLPASWPDLK